MVFLSSSLILFQVAHNNFGFDAKVLKNNLVQFNISVPDNLMMFDSIHLMKEVRNAGANLPRLNLESCLNYFFNENQANPHDAYNDANDCRRISEQGAKKLGYGSLRHFIDNNDDFLKSFEYV